MSITGKCHFKIHRFEVSDLDRAVLLSFHHNIVLSPLRDCGQEWVIFLCNCRNMGMWFYVALVIPFSKLGIIGVMDIPVLMTVNDSWTSSCLSATQSQNDGLQTVLETLYCADRTDGTDCVDLGRTTSFFKGYGWRYSVLFLLSKNQDQNQHWLDPTNKYCLCSYNLIYLTPLPYTIVPVQYSEHGRCSLPFFLSIPNTLSRCCKYSLQQLYINPRLKIVPNKLHFFLLFE